MPGKGRMQDLRNGGKLVTDACNLLLDVPVLPMQRKKCLFSQEFKSFFYLPPPLVKEADIVSMRAGAMKLLLHVRCI